MIKAVGLMYAPKWLGRVNRDFQVILEMGRRQGALVQRMRSLSEHTASESRLWDSRVEEIFMEILAQNLRLDPRTIEIYAEERASFEQLARRHVCLPTEGLRTMVSELEDQGFCFRFGLGARVLTPTYFPDGWRVVPTEYSRDRITNSSYGHLIDPTGCQVASVYFCCSPRAGVYEGRILRIP